MSQYPSPYSPPGWQDRGSYGSAASDPAAPARRAAAALMVLGGIMILLGICAGFAASVDPSQLPNPKARENFATLDAQIREKYGLTLSQALHKGAMQTLVASLVVIGMGLWVRSGRRTGIIAGITLVGLLMLVSAPALLVMPGVCNSAFIAGVLILLGFIMRWLVQALRSGGALQAAPAQYPQYQWQVQQYQQQAAAYAQAQAQAQQAAAIGVQRIDHATIDVSDVERAKAFYGGLLGLAEMPRPAGFDFGGAWFRIGQVDLHLVQREKPETAGGRHVCFWVGDVRGLARRLEAAGFKIEWETRYVIPGIERFFVRDPDGNRVEFQGAEAGTPLPASA